MQKNNQGSTTSTATGQAEGKGKDKATGYSFPLTECCPPGTKFQGYDSFGNKVCY